MSESQGQQKEGCLKKLIDFLNGLLPWLRFVVNIGFYIAFIWVIIHAGNKLWINTLPQEPKAINELIKVIKENTKTVTTQRHSKEKTKIEQEFKDSSPSYYRNPVWFPPLDSANTTIETSKAEDIPESYTIQKDDLDNALKAVAMASRQEVIEDYHKSFSILVAILAVFGIGFPIIVALVQHSFNDRDLDKIENTATKADEAVKQVNSIQTEANKATEIALMAANEATSAIKDATNAIANADDAAKKADDAAQKADAAAQKADAAVSEAKDAIENIIQVNFEMHDEMVIIHDGLAALCMSQTFEKNKLYGCIHIGQSIYHYMKTNIFSISIERMEILLSLIDNFVKYFDEKTIQDIKNDKIFKSNTIKMLNSLIQTIKNFVKNTQLDNKEQDKEFNQLKIKLIEKPKKLEEISNILKK